ncbi:hypothetical protein O9G_004658 [Rozella allomycis CSF55]|uniref:C3H1-type domain-containing protein n=1 Tax=Rozella allomycis (strain CSF55) TaxID=988480 RepID=A0A075AZ84_ROZAC|nr:hypothetical protein O9G_004658 [Rozella allomycis CSF55]|eukprot:EPZ35454.1 hypothetical protein O9G_004658 [Rozella allomycis CSF55]
MMTSVSKEASAQNGNSFNNINGMNSLDDARNVTNESMVGDWGQQIPLNSIGVNSVHVSKKISLYKTELCRTFEETGFCRYGTKCQFAHDMSELRSVARHPRYKTEICKTFWEQGNCPYGKRCCFIHTERPAHLPSTTTIAEYKEMKAKENDEISFPRRMSIASATHSEFINESDPNKSNSTEQIQRRKSFVWPLNTKNTGIMDRVTELLPFRQEDVDFINQAYPKRTGIEKDISTLSAYSCINKSYNFPSNSPKPINNSIEDSQPLRPRSFSIHEENNCGGEKIYLPNRHHSMSLPSSEKPRFDLNPASSIELSELLDKKLTVDDNELTQCEMLKDEVIELPESLMELSVQRTRRGSSLTGLHFVKSISSTGNEDTEIDFPNLDYFSGLNEKTFN